MDDLISRAAAIAKVKEARKAARTLTGMDFVMMLEKQPAVDAAPVVRCRDCKYGEPETNARGEDMVMCQNQENPIGDVDWLMPPEFYCADGERRESE